MRFPAVFVNHGGGPLPLMGKQRALAEHMRAIVTEHLPPHTGGARPNAIVVISAHHEARPVEITSGTSPPMLYDYVGFPAEAYRYRYPAPGSAELASKIQGLLRSGGIDSKLNGARGFDHGAFVPLMIM